MIESHQLLVQEMVLIGTLLEAKVLFDVLLQAKLCAVIGCGEVIDV